MNTTYCPQGHQINQQSDRTVSGFCRVCKQESDRDRRSDQRAVLAAARALESVGVVFPKAGEEVSAADLIRQMLELQTP